MMGPQQPKIPFSPQEDADTRLLLHMADAMQKGCRKITIHNVDTDVVVVTVATFNKITPDELGLPLVSSQAFDV